MTEGLSELSGQARIGDRARGPSNTAGGIVGDDEPEIKTGQWRGLGTELNVTSSGASVPLCRNSTGLIPERLVPDSSGHFKARGTVFQEGLRADYELCREDAAEHERH
jgi:hypothetical protein